MPLIGCQMHFLELAWAVLVVVEEFTTFAREHLPKLVHCRDSYLRTSQASENHLHPMVTTIGVLVVSAEESAIPHWPPTHSFLQIRTYRFLI